MSQTVRGVISRKKGEPVEVVDIVIPDPGPGEVVVRVAGAAVNPTDLLMRSGQHDIARAYVLYREKRSQARAASSSRKRERSLRAGVSSAVWPHVERIASPFAGAVHENHTSFKKPTCPEPYSAQPWLQSPPVKLVWPSVPVVAPTRLKATLPVALPRASGVAHASDPPTGACGNCWTCGNVSWPVRPGPRAKTSSCA